MLLIPGGKIFFLASDGELTSDVAGRMEAGRRRTRWVNRDYLAAMLTPDRLADLRRALAADAPVNRDFSPILYYYHLRYWMSQFQVRFGLLEAAAAGAAGGLPGAAAAGSAGRLRGGFAASALEVVLLLGFQVLFGACTTRWG